MLFSGKLDLAPHDFVTVVDGGGKTSLLKKLAAELTEQGEKVLLTTTTHMQLPDPALYTVFLRDQEDREAYTSRIAACQDAAVFAAEYRVNDWKVKGAEDGLYDRIYRKIPDRIFLCEGDGCAGHSFKIFRDNEPVIPNETTRLLFIAGADAWGRPCRDVLFKCPDVFRDRVFDGEFWKEELARALDRVRSMYRGPIDLVINKAEGTYEEGAREMAGEALALADRVWISSLREDRIELVI